MLGSESSNCTFAFIGTGGIPNRYGGFESFLENCTPIINKSGYRVIVTCYTGFYSDRSISFNGVQRKFTSIPVNGFWSILHDLRAFCLVFFEARYIILLGVSGALWLPFLRPLADLWGKKIIVNLDGVEWRREKYSFSTRILLWFLDFLAQRFAHRVVIDNRALESFIFYFAKSKAHLIAYSGDHVLSGRNNSELQYILTIARIEPENNIDLMIRGFLKSRALLYVVIGNWNSSEYGRSLRKEYSSDVRLKLLDPVYDSQVIADWRENCIAYVHGHSVGGSNPSLIEMLFYCRPIIAFDCSFNRATAHNRAHYFSDSGMLSEYIDMAISGELVFEEIDLSPYTSSEVASKYIAVCREFSDV